MGMERAKTEGEGGEAEARRTSPHQQCSSLDLASTPHLRSVTTVVIDTLIRNWYLLYDLESYLLVHLTLF